MKIVDIRDSFHEYRKSGLLIAVRDCDYKCCHEGGYDISMCHNYHLDGAKEIELSPDNLGNRIINNNTIDCIVIAGKEPMLDKYFNDIVSTINYLRNNKWNKDIVIYTGYTEEELKEKINILKNNKNIIIKFGRFIPNQKPIYDEIGGIFLANHGQYFKRIS